MNKSSRSEIGFCSKALLSRTFGVRGCLGVLNVLSPSLLAPLSCSGTVCAVTPRPVDPTAPHLPERHAEPVPGDSWCVIRSIHAVWCATGPRYEVVGVVAVLSSEHIRSLSYPSVTIEKGLCGFRCFVVVS